MKRNFNVALESGQGEIRAVSSPRIFKDTSARRTRTKCISSSYLEPGRFCSIEAAIFDRKWGFY